MEHLDLYAVADLAKRLVQPLAWVGMLQLVAVVVVVEQVELGLKQHHLHMGVEALVHQQYHWPEEHSVVMEVHSQIKCGAYSSGNSDCLPPKFSLDQQIAKIHFVRNEMNQFKFLLYVQALMQHSPCRPSQC